MSRSAPASRARAVRFTVRLRASARVAAGRTSAGDGGTTTCGKPSDGGAASDDDVEDMDDRLGRVRNVRGWGAVEAVAGAVVDVFIVRFGTCPPAPVPVPVPPVVMMVLDSRRGATRAGGITIGSRA